MDQSHLIEGAILPQCAVDSSTEAGGHGLGVQATVVVALVEEEHDLVARLELCDVLAAGFDDTGAIGGGDDVLAEGKGVFALRDDQVAVVEGGALDLKRGFVSGRLPFSNAKDERLTRTSLSPYSGLGTSSLYWRLSKLPVPMMFHCFMMTVFDGLEKAESWDWGFSSSKGNLEEEEIVGNLNAYRELSERADPGCISKL